MNNSVVITNVTSGDFEIAIDINHKKCREYADIMYKDRTWDDEDDLDWIVDEYMIRDGMSKRRFRSLFLGVAEYIRLREWHGEDYTSAEACDIVAQAYNDLVRDGYFNERR